MYIYACNTYGHINKSSLVVKYIIENQQSTLQKKSFYVRERHFLASDIRLIAECIYSSKYISQDEAERFVDIMREFVSDYEADAIQTNALVTNRVRTLNKATLGKRNRVV